MAAIMVGGQSFACLDVDDSWKYKEIRVETALRWPLELKNTRENSSSRHWCIGENQIRRYTVVPGIKMFLSAEVEFVNGENLELDSIVLSTGYCSNVPYWLQETDFFSKNGFPKAPFPSGWKGKAGLYAVGSHEEGSLVLLLTPLKWLKIFGMFGKMT